MAGNPVTPLRAAESLNPGEAERQDGPAFGDSYHADIRRLIRMTLEFEECDIYEASSGENGLTAAATLRPDVVLLDVMMPGEFDGFEVCRMLKITPGLAHVKVVILSARGTAADLQNGKDSGADGYLVKPFSPLELTRLVLSLASRVEAA